MITIKTVTVRNFEIRFQIYIFYNCNYRFHLHISLDRKRVFGLQKNGFRSSSQAVACTVRCTLLSLALYTPVATHGRGVLQSLLFSVKCQ